MLAGCVAWCENSHGSSESRGPCSARRAYGAGTSEVDELQYAELIERALSAMTEGDTVRALALADQAAAHRPDDATVRNLRAQALLNMGSGAQAFEEAQQVVEIEPDQPEGYLVLGMAAWEEGRLEFAQRTLEHAVRLSGGDTEMLARFAWFMACERGPRPAEQAAEDALRADPHSSISLAALALAQLRQNQFSLAEQTLGRAEEMEADDVHLQAVRIALLEKQGRNAEAERLAERMAGQPGTEELVDSVRDEARRRRVSRTLLERRAVQQALLRRVEPRRGWPTVLGFFVLALVVLGVTGALFPTVGWRGMLVGLLCLLIPLAVLLRLFRD